MKSNTGNNKLWRTSYKGKVVYAYAATAVQAAVAMKEKLSVPFVNPEWVYEVPPLKVFSTDIFYSEHSGEEVLIVAEDIHAAWRIFYSFAYDENHNCNFHDYTPKAGFRFIGELNDLVPNKMISRGVYLYGSLKEFDDLELFHEIIF